MNIDEVADDFPNIGSDHREWLRNAERKAADGYRLKSDPEGDAEAADRHILIALNLLYSNQRDGIAQARRALIAAHGRLHQLATIDRAVSKP